MGQPVVHFEIIGKDGEALWRYYSELFGLGDRHGQSDELRHGGAGGERQCGRSSASAAGSSGYPDFESRVTFYVEVPDVEAALARASTTSR